MSECDLISAKSDSINMNHDKEWPLHKAVFRKNTIMLNDLLMACKTNANDKDSEVRFKESITFSSSSYFL